MWAEPVNPSRHDTVAPDRSVDAMVVIVEVRGDFDVRVKLYTVPRLVTCSMVPIGSLEEYATLSISRLLKKSISQDRSVVVFTTHVNTTSVPGQLYALSAVRVALPTMTSYNNKSEVQLCCRCSYTKYLHGMIEGFDNCTIHFSEIIL